MSAENKNLSLMRELIRKYPEEAEKFIAKLKDSNEEKRKRMDDDNYYENKMGK